MCATKEQWELIEKIEDELGVWFSGETMGEAAGFILKYIDEYHESKVVNK